jgi:hypothetical protein
MIKVYAALFALAVGVAGATAVHAEGGCGLGYHRGPYGGCRPNESAPAPVVPVPVPGGVIYAPEGGACPNGYHLGPEGRRCWANETAPVYAPAGRACPYGYHLGPEGRRCWPN